MLLETDILNGLTVVIPTYGRSDKILQSIYSCLHPEVFIVIVDDNGLNTDNQIATKKLIDSITSDYTDNLIYHALDTNSGACIARNKGIELAKTSVVTFLDDDDMLLVEETLQKLEYFENQIDFDICCSDMFSRFNGKEYQLPFCYFRGLTPIDLLLDGNCYTPMIMAKREALLRIGGFDNCKKYQDHVLMLKIHLSKLNVCYFDKPAFIHVDHDEYRISNKACSYQTVKFRFKYEFKLLNEIDLKPNEFNRLNNVISDRKSYLCFYFIVMPRLDTFIKRFIGTKRFLNSIQDNKSNLFIIVKSFFYALKTVDGLPFFIKRFAYKLKGKR
ncbi:glycosyltransferase family 2 protein [Shewanella sp. MEBiC00475]|uniref:glycosyltransferase family 2 protein n=1 Tax=Shewanella sp. MEBiC00475 TaxID=2575361 RepID=UPI0010C11640|nr:glycosyltransferase family 2 protein [Shewanella sp. MEBiC00475]